VHHLPVLPLALLQKREGLLHRVEITVARDGQRIDERIAPEVPGESGTFVFA